MSTIDNILFERLCENMNNRKANDLVEHVETKKSDEIKNIKETDNILE